MWHANPSSKDFIVYQSQVHGLLPCLMCYTKGLAMGKVTSLFLSPPIQIRIQTSSAISINTHELRNHHNVIKNGVCNYMHFVCNTIQTSSRSDGHRNLSWRFVRLQSGTGLVMQGFWFIGYPAYLQKTTMVITLSQHYILNSSYNCHTLCLPVNSSHEMPSRKPGLHHFNFSATYLEVHSTFQF